MRFIFAVWLAVSVLLTAAARDARAQAEAAPLPELPAELADESVVGVFVVDLRRVTPERLSASLRAAGIAEHELMQQAQAGYEEWSQKMREAGVRAWATALVWPAGADEPQEPIVLAALEEGADRGRAEEALVQHLPERLQEELRPRDLGQRWLEVAMGQALPSGGDAERQAQLRAAMSADAEVHVLAFPNVSLRQLLLEAERQMPPALAQEAAAADWLALSVTAGEEPQVTAVVQAHDEAAAQRLQEHLRTFLRRAPQLAREPQVLPAVPLPEPFSVLATIEDDQIAREGSRVTLTLPGPQLRTIGQAALPALTAARQQAQAVASMSHMHQLAILFHQYIADHDGALPDSLDDLKPYVGDEAFRLITTNPRTGQNPGYVYEKPAADVDDIEDPSNTVIFRELQDGEPDPDGAAAYADGSVRMLTREDDAAANGAREGR